MSQLSPVVLDTLRRIRAPVLFAKCFVFVFFFFSVLLFKRKEVLFCFKYPSVGPPSSGEVLDY